jgi:hypothetical protein
VSLRSACEGDIEDLRTWKNASRAWFFHKEEISPSQQAEWFSSYLKRPDDHMYMVIVDGDAVGCMGFRCCQDAIDVYNVIRGKHSHPRAGTMSKALSLMCSFADANYHLPVTLKVIVGNPAIQWYLKQGFQLVSQNEDYASMELAGSFQTPFEVEEVLVNQ